MILFVRQHFMLCYYLVTVGITAKNKLKCLELICTNEFTVYTK